MIDCIALFNDFCLDELRGEIVMHIGQTPAAEVKEDDRAFLIIPDSGGPEARNWSRICIRSLCVRYTMEWFLEAGWARLTVASARGFMPTTVLVEGVSKERMLETYGRIRYRIGRREVRLSEIVVASGR